MPTYERQVKCIQSKLENGGTSSGKDVGKKVLNLQEPIRRPMYSTNIGSKSVTTATMTSSQSSDDDSLYFEKEKREGSSGPSGKLVSTFETKESPDPVLDSLFLYASGSSDETVSTIYNGSCSSCTLMNKAGLDVVSPFPGQMQASSKRSKDQHASFVALSEKKRVALLVMCIGDTIRVVPLTSQYSSPLVVRDLAIIIEYELRQSLDLKAHGYMPMNEKCNRIASHMPRCNQILDDGAPPTPTNVDVSFDLRKALRHARVASGLSIDCYELFTQWLQSREGLANGRRKRRSRCMTCRDSNKNHVRSPNPCHHSICDLATCRSTIGLFDAAHNLFDESNESSDQAMSHFERLCKNEINHFGTDVIKGIPCPSETCTRVLLAPARKGKRMSGWNILLCSCGHSVCADCSSSPAHPGISCRMYKQWRRARETGRVQSQFNRHIQSLKEKEVRPEISNSGRTDTSSSSPRDENEPSRTYPFQYIDEYWHLLCSEATLRDTESKLVNCSSEESHHGELSISQQLSQILIWLRTKIIYLGDPGDVLMKAIKDVEELELAHDIRILMRRDSELDVSLENSGVVARVALAMCKVQERRLRQQQELCGDTNKILLKPTKSKLPMFASPHLEALCVMEPFIFKVFVSEGLGKAVHALRFDPPKENSIEMVKVTRRSFRKPRSRRTSKSKGMSSIGNPCDPDHHDIQRNKLKELRHDEL